MGFNQFRFLTPKSNWENNIFYMPRDKKNGVKRYYGKLKGNYNFTPNWTSNLLYQTVSDADYFADFNNGSVESANIVYLERHIDLSYNDNNWIFKALLSDYQSPKGSLLDVDNTPYNRLPDIFLRYNSNNWNNISFNTKADYTNFRKKDY